MSILKGILSESKEHYLEAKEKIERKLSNLPKGSVKERKISGRKYYYLQYRKGKKIIHKYLGRKKPEDILGQVKERRRLELELKKVDQALNLLKRAEGKRRG
jgi:hypothetical protein